MHNAVRSFIKEVRREFPYKFRFKNVLEVGSKNINGSPRKYFWFCDYTGIDLSKGKGVDIVANFAEINLGHDRYNTVLCCEVLEHCKEWRQVLEKMLIIAKPGGLILITCAGPDRAEHGTKRTTPEASPDTTDYYRNITTEDFKSVLPSELFVQYCLMYGRGKNDLYFYGIKK